MSRSRGSPKSAASGSAAALGDTKTVQRRSSVLQRMRDGNSFSDLVISVNGTSISCHRAVVAELAPFFATALSGQFREASERRISIGDTTERAVHVLLDYAYEVPSFVEKLSADYSLALEVWELANRYELKNLEVECSKAAVKHLNVENCLELYAKVCLYGCSEGAKETFTLLAHNFRTVFNTPAAKLLPFEELDKIISSPELVAEEIERFMGIVSWTDGNEQRMVAVRNLIRTLRFELFNDDELNLVLDDKYATMLPKNVLMGILKNKPNRCAFMPNGVLLQKINYYQYSNLSSQVSGANSSTVVLDVPVLNSDALDVPKCIYFKCRHFIMSLSFKLRASRKLHLVLKCERRAVILSKENLEQDISKHSFSLRCAIVTPDKWMDISTQTVKGLESRQLELRTEIKSERGKTESSVLVFSCSAQPITENSRGTDHNIFHHPPTDGFDSPLDWD